MLSSSSLLFRNHHCGDSLDEPSDLMTWRLRGERVCRRRSPMDYSGCRYYMEQLLLDGGAIGMLAPSI